MWNDPVNNAAEDHPKRRRAFHELTRPNPEEKLAHKMECFVDRK